MPPGTGSIAKNMNPFRLLRNKFSDLLETLTENIVAKPHLKSEIVSRNLIVDSLWADIELPSPSLKIADYVYQAFEKYGDRTALIDSLTSHSLSYSEILDKTRHLTGALALRDISFGHRSIVITHNLPDFLVTFLALNSLGVTVAFISPFSTKAEIESYMVQTDCESIFVHHKILELVKEAASNVPGFNMKQIYVLEPLTATYTNTMAVRSVNGAPNLTVNDLCREGMSSKYRSIHYPIQDVAIIPFSSGTTGKPKGVMLSNRNILSNILQTREVTKSPDHKMVTGLLPFFHIYGFTVNLLNVLTSGDTVVTFSSFEPLAYLQALEKYKISYLFIVPTIAQFLINTPHFNQFDLSHIKMVFSGASHLPATLADQLYGRLQNKVKILQGYGMTEMSPVSHCLPFDSDYTESIGFIIPNTKCKVVDVDSGECLPINKKGELCVKGPQVMLGYLNNLEATQDMIDHEGWLHTGDVACYDEKGYFYITDRMKELIKYKGYQVAPAELETILLSHPAVMDAAVIGIPDVEGGEVPKAFVVTRRPTNPRDIINYLNNKVSPHKRLRGGIQFIDAIPKSPAGKILRKQLKALV